LLGAALSSALRLRLEERLRPEGSSVEGPQVLVEVEEAGGVIHGFSPSISSVLTQPVMEMN
jgi:hypothetical protein